MEHPLISAVILNYRSPQDVVQCVQSLKEQTIANRLEIIVVDNHSQDDSIGVIRNRLGDIDNVRIIETSNNIGYGRGNNFGESFTKGEFLVIINPDNSFEPDALERMVKKMQQEADIGILSPKLMYRDGTRRESCRMFPNPFDLLIKRTFLGRLFPRRLARYLERDKDPDEIRNVDWVVGTCMLLRRDFFGQLGGFDDRFFLFFDDTDLCRRCWEAGKRVVYFPEVQALDRKHRLSDGGFLAILTKRVGRVHIQSAFKYFWKWRKT